MEAATDSPTKTLAVIGAGPKAAAIAAKAQVFRDLGLGSIDVVVVEEHSIAAHWAGKAGFTDGRQGLGTPPEKDIGFPYRSEHGTEVDAEMQRYSWQMFLIVKGTFSDWLDRGRPQPCHAEWAEYLQWAFEKSSPRLVMGKLCKVLPQEGRLELEVRTDEGPQTLLVDGLVLTGPGEPLSIAGLQEEDPEAILNGRNYWQRLPIFSEMGSGRVAVIGGGETAASIVLSLLDMSPGLEIDLINRHGTIYTRGEGFHENRLFSLTDDWAQMGDLDREDFIKRTDRGVFSVAAKREMDHALNVRLRAGHITAIHRAGHRVNVRIERKGNQSVDLHYDKVIVAIGFDPLSSLRLVQGCQPPKTKEEVRRFRQGIDRHLRAPLSLMGDLPANPPINVHVPMLAGLSQGPGFPNLSCLGSLSDRILALYTLPPI